MTSPDVNTDRLNRSQKYFERGNKFLEQAQYQKALEEYAQSFEVMSIYIQFCNIKEYSSYFPASQRNVLIWLCNFFVKVETCYRKVKDYKNANIFLEILREIDSCFQEIYKGLDVQQLKIYEKFSEGLKIAVMNQELTANIQQSEIPPEYSSYELNKLAKQIIAELDKCRKCDICRLKPKVGLNNSSSSSDSCFIATAAYSTATHPDLDTFRQFRDEKLLTHFAGKHLVSIYYQIGPSIAHYVDKQQHIKCFLRQQLGRLAEWMRRQKVTSR